MDFISTTNTLANDGTSSLFGISIDTLVSVLTSALMALIVLLLHYRFQVYHEQKREFKNLKNTESYFFLLLSILIDATKRYVDTFSGLAKQMRDQSVTNYTVNVITSMNIDEIKGIQPDRLFKIFITNKIGDSSKIIATYIDMNKHLTAIDIIMGQREEYFRRFMRNERTHQGEYNKHAERLRKMHDRLLHELKNNPELRDDFVNRLMEIHGTWQKKENMRNLYVAKEHLFEPLHDLCTTIRNIP